VTITAFSLRHGRTASREIVRLPQHNWIQFVTFATTNPVMVGSTPEQMLKADVKAEEEAIRLYKDIMIKQKISEGDDATQHLFEEILTSSAIAPGGERDFRVVISARV